MDFLQADDLGDEELTLKIRRLVPAIPQQEQLPTYEFDIFHTQTGERLGEIFFRVGEGELTYYGGHLSYSVLPPFRGRRYAAKACLLLKPLARRHQMERIYIACRPNNIASRKTCETAGASLLEIAHVPEHLTLYQNGVRTACIYELVL